MDIQNQFQHYLDNHPNREVLTRLMNESKYESSLGDISDDIRAIQLADMLGLTLLGNGAHRFTVEYKGHAIKLPLEAIGFADNEQELYLWNVMNNTTRKYFMPCIGGNSTFAIFPIAKTIEWDEWKDIYQANAHKYESLGDELKRLGLHLDDCDFDEHRYDQWGFYQGELIILDYANCYFEQ